VQPNIIITVDAAMTVGGLGRSLSVVSVTEGEVKDYSGIRDGTMLIEQIMYR
jgi:hypothetical protein